MNRRNFLKRLSKVATLPIVASLIKLPTADNPDIPIEFEDVEPQKIVRWDGAGNSWEKNSDAKEWQQTSFASNFYGEAIFIKDGLTYTEEI